MVFVVKADNVLFKKRSDHIWWWFYAEIWEFLKGSDTFSFALFVVGLWPAKQGEHCFFLSSSVNRACPLSCPGWDLEGVKLLQTYKDATEIHALSSGQKAVVIGTSFIGV